MISNPLIVYNSDILQSRTDALKVLDTYGLPHNLAGVNQSASFPADDTWNSLFNGTRTITPGTFQINGVTDNQFDGQNLLTAVAHFRQVYPQLDALYLSTYTILTVFGAPTGGGANVPLSAVLSNSFLGNGIDVLPHGRFGSPQTTSNNFDFTVEAIARSGNRVFDDAIAGDRLSRTNFNKSLLHLSSDATGGADLISDSLGFTATYWQDWWAHLGTKVNVRTNLGVDYPWGTADPKDFRDGVLVSPLDIFAHVGAFNYNDDTANAGAHVYSNNYRVQPGGWCCHSYSFLWYFAQDFLYNGGSAAFATVGEPLATGIREPREVFDALIDGTRTISECLPVSVVPDGTPNFPVGSNYQRMTVLGNPLCRPYFQQSPRLIGSAVL